MNFVIKVDPHIVCTSANYLQLSPSGRAQVDAALLAQCDDWIKDHDASTLIVETGVADLDEASENAHTKLITDFNSGSAPNTQIFLRDATPEDWIIGEDDHSEMPVIFLNSGLTNPKEFSTVWPTGGGGDTYVGSGCFLLEFIEAA
jgi:hypothetical protein